MSHSMFALRALTTAAVLCAAPSAYGQQVADTLFRPVVAAPSFAPGAGPLVLLDEAHANYHTVDGRYRVFAGLLRNDGYRVEPNRAPFTRAALDSARILVIANALSEAQRNRWTLPAVPAFTASEVAAVRDWVRSGGSLLLIADHMPFPGAARELAMAFGIAFADGFVVDSAQQTGVLRFALGDGTLSRHPITDGRNDRERIDSVWTFTGQAFRLLDGGDPLLILGPHTTLLLPRQAWVFSDSTPRMAAQGMLQGAALRVGRGRIAVFGEAAMFSAQVQGAQRVPMGMNVPVAHQNAQFLLNVVHWLSGMLDP